MGKRTNLAFDFLFLYPCRDACLFQTSDRPTARSWLVGLHSQPTGGWSLCRRGVPCSKPLPRQRGNVRFFDETTSDSHCQSHEWTALRCGSSSCPLLGAGLRHYRRRSLNRTYLFRLQLCPLPRRAGSAGLRLAFMAGKQTRRTKTGRH